MKSIEEIKKNLGQIMNIRWLVIIFIVGIGLMLLPDNGKKTPDKAGKVKEEYVNYKEEIENQLESVLSSVKGVGKTDVMIILSDDGEYLYAKDEKSDVSEEENKTGVSEEKTYVLRGDDTGGESPIILRKDMPQVSGVLVIATGAGDSKIRSDIINATRAVLGVKAHRIEVLERK